MIRPITIAALAVIALAGCSDDAGQPPTDPERTANSASPKSAPANTASGTATTVSSGSPTAVPSMQLGGKWYPLPVARCMQKIWDDRVAEWNKLVEERDAKGASVVVVAGVKYEDFGSYARARGWPTTFEATMRHPATAKACPLGR